VANSELRRRRARRWLFLSDDGVLTDPSAFATDDWHEPRAAVLHLYEVLDRVSSECRAVFVLRFVEGLELVELAAVLGCSLATAKRRVADASRRICLLTAGDPILAPYLEARR
jgi:RNA polymerase sigma-70 factor (ECF subfamily)